MSSGSPATPAAAVPAAGPRRHRHTLSIRSLILLMLLAVSIGSTVVVGVIGYVNGSDSLRRAAYDRLTEVRDSRAREMVQLFTTVQDQLLLAGQDGSVVDAEQAFSAGVAELDAGGSLAPDQSAALSSWYRTDFAEAYAKASGATGDVSAFMPQDTAGQYLQYHYTLHADADRLADAGDGSAWSAASAEYHDYLARMATLQQYGDLALIDADGRVVYTADKHVDLGAQLRSGPYSFTGLAQAYDETMSRNRIDQVAFSDIAPYGPSLDAQTAWVVAPIASDDDIIGAIAVQLPVDRIDQVMTGGRSWSSSGLGSTGETFLVGDDGRMRSVSRELVQHPTDYVDAAVAGGLNRAQAQRARDRGDTLGIQTVRTKAVTEALLGKTGTVTTDGYLGHPVIAAYAPLALPAANLHWVVVAQIDQAEALAPVDDFTARLGVSAAIIVAVVSLISVIIAGVAVRPLRRLRAGARRIAAGEVGVQVDVGESDELVDVGAAFNDMSNSLALKQQLLDQQAEENEKLLTTLMPSNLAEQYRAGTKTIVEDHQEVTVLFADIVGFEEFSSGMTSAKALDILNDIFRALDDAAEEHGVERVRTTRQGYLASCGLVVPRVDNARRGVEFAIEAQRIVERFGAAQGARLAIRAGVDTGTVTSGLVGRARVVYDLWGEAVNLAYRLQGQAGDAGIFLTQRVVDKVPQQLPLEDAGTTTTATGDQHVWRIDPSYDPTEAAPATAPATPTL